MADQQLLITIFFFPNNQFGLRGYGVIIPILLCALSLWVSFLFSLPLTL